MIINKYYIFLLNSRFNKSHYIFIKNYLSHKYLSFVNLEITLYYYKNNYIKEGFY